MDPSFGGGVFLRAACKRIAALGGNPSGQVMGSEIDPVAHSRASNTLRDEFGVRDVPLRCCDFFELEPASKLVDAVVGNPPFIRYQQFSGKGRNRAIRRSLTQGVELSGLASSWAPFLVHATSMLKRGGRLAMVVPFEMSHAAYARPVLQYLATTFGKVTLLTFQRRMFANLSEDTLLLLADNKDAHSTEFAWRDLSSPDELVNILSSKSTGTIEETSPLDHNALCRGDQRLIEYFLPANVRGLYGELKKLPDIRRLADLAHVGIGYVTGANDYFHLSPLLTKLWHIPREFLKPAVRRGRILRGLSFTRKDWQAGLDSQDTGYLLYIDGEGRLPDGVVQYLEQGERSGVSKAYKCRTRSAWYRVQHVHCPDTFLTYMSGAVPKLVANVARVVAPNSLHIVRIHPGCELTAETLATLWQTSLTWLSTEIEGHALGGGLLKMEPSEARNVLLPVVKAHGIPALAKELDEVWRKCGVEDTRARADDEILRNRLGLSKRDCYLLRIGAQTLLDRRHHRGKTNARAS